MHRIVLLTEALPKQQEGIQLWQLLLRSLQQLLTSDGCQTFQICSNQGQTKPPHGRTKQLLWECTEFNMQSLQTTINNHQSRIRVIKPYKASASSPCIRPTSFLPLSCFPTTKAEGPLQAVQSLSVYSITFSPKPLLIGNLPDL